MMIKIISGSYADSSVVSVRFNLGLNPMVSSKGKVLFHPYVLQYGTERKKWNRHIFEWESVRLGEC